ncbi:uncharacterized protein LOC107466221 [Arachis duranensis]|uniref:Uncharacterized protein LOC107466221 n=1 Tax=Arachis duranensis TaxID=130453 RepID=A0A6P4C647_ARADU|nr:uncharacterized protein LOC107466221 [Arachis duranensis]
MGGDLVISTPWLRTPRAYIVDYDAAFFCFWHEGQFVTVHVFAQPKGLPLQRAHDHSIPLTKGAEPVKVRSYRALNKITIKDSFPIPAVDEFLDELFGAAIFSKLDLRSEYHQILLTPEDRHKTAFRTHQGLYEWLVMSFGLTNAPTTFQHLMNDVFRPHLWKFVLVFFDDILVYSSSWALHLQHLEMVLKILQRECLFAKLSKCLFGMVEIDYLGHTISRNGVHMKQAKVKGYATLAAPLTDLLKKDAFLWSTEASAAFQYLKDTIISQPVLALPNFELPFELETDASGIGISAVLKQEKHPIAYFSKKLSSTMQQQSTYVREFYAITEAVAKFRHIREALHYPLGSAKFNQTLHTPEQQKWLHKLLGFDFEIQYKSGRENVAADALSRQNPQGEGNYSSRNGLLLWRNRVVIPLGSNLIKIFLKEYHDSTVPFVNKPKPKRSSRLVYCDRLSKFVYFIVLKRDFDSRTVAEAFIGNVVKLHGFPNSIVSDQDHIFISKFWQHLFKLQSTELGMSFAYHPQTDGQSKVVNKALEMYLRCFCFDNPSKWKDLLPWAQFWYNTSFHSSIKMLPYKALYGRDPPSLIRYEVSSQDDQSLQDILLERDRSIEQLKCNLARSQQFMKPFADRRHRHVTFKEGDWVLVKLQPYRQHSVALRNTQKLGMCYFGPFQIDRKINEVDYKLNLPPEARIHDVFHVSALKPFRGENHDQYLPFSLQTLEIGPILQPTEILDSRTVIKNGHEEPQVKIR